MWSKFKGTGIPVRLGSSDFPSMGGGSREVLFDNQVWSKETILGDSFGKSFGTSEAKTQEFDHGKLLILFARTGSDC